MCVCAPTFIALIPARGGSRGIPRKNVKPLAGQPLIAWTIQAARSCRRICRTVVSTDDDEIADVAREWGGEVPFRRPASLAGDAASTDAVVAHAIAWFREQAPPGPEYLVVLQPTSPLRTAADIEAAMDLALRSGAPAVVSVSPMVQHPCYARCLDAAGRLHPFFPPPADGARPDLKRRQELPEAFSENGAIFLCRCEDYLRERTFFSDRTVGSLMPEERSLDIDSPWHFHLAELILSAARTTAGPEAVRVV